ncbi:ORF6N domain-containing protein [Psychrobacillus sp. FSL K6-2365]|uniref:ORF6N domain-containing protein n=1 Tax=Psychrobacillus sp. FSL K6-2365 TaxID=2921546 RepID=UPI0030F82449
MKQLQTIEQSGQRVLTTSQLAASYGAEKQQISKNFTRNIDRYKEGKHYFSLTGTEKHDFLNHVQIDDGSKNAQVLYLWTEKGAWLHAKSLNTDEAWDAYEKLVDEYYKLAKEKKPLSPLEIMQMQIKQLVEQEQRLNEQDNRIGKIETEQQNITEIIGLTVVEWRKKVTNILNRIAKNNGGFQMYQDIRNESYKMLEERAKCKLSIRVTNKQKVMALNGVPKSTVNKVSKLDAISEDARLTEIYLAIVKELAIKYRVSITDFEVN